MSRHGNIETTYTGSGIRYQVEVWHDGLSKYQIIRGDNEYVVGKKAQAKMAQWDEMWERKTAVEKARIERQLHAQNKEEKKQIALERTQEAQDSLASLDNILSHTLAIDDTVDWEKLKDLSDYPLPKPSKPNLPIKPTPPKISTAPDSTHLRYKPQLDLLDRLFKSREKTKIREAEELYKHDYLQWEKSKEQLELEYKAIVQEYNDSIEELKKSYQQAVKEWEEAKKKYLQKRDENNKSVDEKKESYFKGDPEAILDYFDMVLSNSEYPDYFPQSYDLDYNPDGKYLIIDYQLPDSATIPTVKEIKYIQSRDEFTESHITSAQKNRLYDNLLYQIALRTIHEVFEADAINALIFVVFNGYVKSIDPATGQEKTACVLSLQANQSEFEVINLAKIIPKACFKNLKGIGSSKLYSLTPIAPIMNVDREDKRFVDSYEVADGLGEQDNLAAMDWEDFEHLVREVFEKEFASTGGEVKVTRASRDGGIDAVAFDPDPLRGGKIVIQAKRYTNTVGVSAVRDLFGSVMNEGATKGILVTTADYGPDAYNFAKGKPLTLLNGNNLLHLLEKHGHKAKIDIQEAKRIMANKD